MPSPWQMCGISKSNTSSNSAMQTAAPCAHKSLIINCGRVFPVTFSGVNKRLKHKLTTPTHLLHKFHSSLFKHLFFSLTRGILGGNQKGGEKKQKVSTLTVTVLRSALMMSHSWRRSQTGKHGRANPGAETSICNISPWCTDNSGTDICTQPGIESHFWHSEIKTLCSLDHHRPQVST